MTGSTQSSLTGAESKLMRITLSLTMTPTFMTLTLSLTLTIDQKKSAISQMEMGPLSPVGQGIHSIKFIPSKKSMPDTQHTQTHTKDVQVYTTLDVFSHTSHLDKEIFTEPSPFTHLLCTLLNWLHALLHMMYFIMIVKHRTEENSKIYKKERWVFLTYKIRETSKWINKQTTLGDQKENMQYMRRSRRNKTALSVHVSCLLFTWMSEDQAGGNIGRN